VAEDRRGSVSSINEPEDVMTKRLVIAVSVTLALVGLLDGQQPAR
jgi:hypothetical protein